MGIAKKQSYYEKLPKKIAGSSVVFLNKDEKILLVKPNYQEEWLLPGGIVEADESPLEAVKREVREEIGLSFDNFRALSVEYIQANDQVPERYAFMFYGGVLSDKQINEISLQIGELDDYKFMSTEEALTLVAEPMKKRLECFIREQKNNREMLYLENGEKI